MLDLRESGLSFAVLFAFSFSLAVATASTYRLVVQHGRQETRESTRPVYYLLTAANQFIDWLLRHSRQFFCRRRKQTTKQAGVLVFSTM